MTNLVKKTVQKILGTNYVVFKQNGAIAAMSVISAWILVKSFFLGGVAWEIHWQMGLIAIAVILSFKLAARYGAIALFFGYVFVQATYLSFHIIEPWGWVNRNNLLLSLHESFVPFVTFIFAVMFIPLLNKKIVYAAVFFLTFFQATWMIIGKIAAWYPWAGYIQNPSLGACAVLIGVTLCGHYASEKHILNAPRTWIWNTALAAITFTAIMLSGATVPIVGLLSTLLLNAVLLRSVAPKIKIRAILLILVFAGIGAAVFTTRDFYTTNGRFEVWELAMQWFYRSANHWVGTGLGTNKFLVPHLQMQHGVVRQGGFVHMHNEYLQCLLELGGKIGRAHV